MSRFLTGLWDFSDLNRYNLLRAAQIHNGKCSAVSRLRVDEMQNSYSVAKVLTMTAIGLLYDRGCISLSEHITDIFPEERDAIRDIRWSQVTVEHLLMHRSGIPKQFLDIDAQDSGTWGTDDYLRYTLSSGLEYEPGTDEAYSDAAYYLLGRIAAKRAGTSLSLFLKTELLHPLGIRKMAWVTCPHGYEMAATGLFMRAEDLCRIGCLYLQDGCIDGKQVLSEVWCRMAKEKPFEFRVIHENGSYGKGGMMGQMLMIIPEHNRVVAWHAFERKANSKLIRFAAEYLR